jgi:hypothetical protein
MKWTHEDLKSLAAVRCVYLYRAVKPKDVSALPEAAQALWKLGWEMSAQFDAQNLPPCVNSSNTEK